MLLLTPIIALSGVIGCTDDTATDDTSTLDTDADATDDHTHDSDTVDAHIHGLGFWGDSKEVILGTHEGTWRTDSAGEGLLPLCEYGDFMSFVQSPDDPDTYWGSGHWGAGGYSNWGFIESTDGGVTFDEIDLTGQVDFHALGVSPTHPGAIAAVYSGGLFWSGDSGRSWDYTSWNGGPTGLLMGDPAVPVLWAAGSSGIEELRGPDLDSTTVVSGSVHSLDAGPLGLLYSDSEGLHSCAADFGGCTTWPGPSGVTPTHVLQDPDALDHLYVLDTGSSVHHTEDGGETWTVIVEGG